MITLSSVTLAQKDTTIQSTADSIFQKVDLEAAFPGGNAGWRKYLENNLNAEVPAVNGARPRTYTVIIQFIVDTSGNLSDFKALTNHGFGMEQEVTRVIIKGPKWEPAIHNGRKVKAFRKQPVTFQVNRE
ncbi:MAG: hypothetical protein HOP10_04525 [Chitinophagaceae bacterium]|nr:hypothetical protein [Chitinophagaceae bacterium]